MIYLACPYTHDNPAVALKRVVLATKVAGIYVARGAHIYSPLTHSHYIHSAMDPKEQKDADFWINFNWPFMEACSEMIIIQTEGWRESKGIRREIEYFKSVKKPISFFLPEYITHD